MTSVRSRRPLAGRHSYDACGLGICTPLCGIHGGAAVDPAGLEGRWEIAAALEELDGLDGAPTHPESPASH
jgi:hypothetical protein